MFQAGVDLVRYMVRSLSGSAWSEVEGRVSLVGAQGGLAVVGGCRFVTSGDRIARVLQS